MVLGPPGRPEEQGAQALCCLAWSWPRESSAACSSLFSLPPVIQTDAKQASFCFTVLKMWSPPAPLLQPSGLCGAPRSSSQCPPVRNDHFPQLRPQAEGLGGQWLRLLGGSEYLSGPGWLVGRVNAPTVMVQGLPVPRKDLLLLLLLFLQLLLLLLLLQGLEVGVLLLQLPLQALRLPLLLQLLPLVFLGPRVGRGAQQDVALEVRGGMPFLFSCLERCLPLMPG